MGSKRRGRTAVKKASTRVAGVRVAKERVVAKDKVTDWRRDLASSFGKPVSKVKVVKQGGVEYLSLVVSPDEVQKYLTKKYPGATRPVRTRGRSRPAPPREPVREEPAAEEEAEAVRPEEEEGEVETAEVATEPEVEVEEEQPPARTLKGRPSPRGRRGPSQAA